MKMKKLTAIMTGLTSFILGVQADIIDVPITFRNIRNNALQSAYDNAQNGDTIRLVKYDQFDYPKDIVMDEEKRVTLNLNNCRMDGNITLMAFLDGNGVDVINGMMNQNSVSVNGSADFTMDNVDINRFNDFVVMNSSGTLSIKNANIHSWNYGAGNLIVAPELIGNTKIELERNVVYQANKLLVIGNDTYSENPIINITQNTIDEVTNPLYFGSDLKKIKGIFANNSVSRVDTFVTNPLYAKGLRIISNNVNDYKDLSKTESISLDSGMMFAMYDAPIQYDSLGTIEDNNYFFNPLFAGIDLNDYNLTENSPLVDLGINLGHSYLGNAPDIGAYESPFTSTPDVPEPTSLLLIGLGATSLLRRKNE